MLVCGGYCIAQLARLDRRNTPLATSPSVLSCSRCISHLVPEIWPSAPLTRTLEEALVLQVHQQTDQLGELADRTLVNLIRTGRFYYPSTFMDLDGALSFASRASCVDSETVVLGLALSGEHARSFLVDLGQSCSTFGVPTAIRRHQPPENGRPLGWEILGYEAGSFHSWLCNDLDLQASIALHLDLQPSALVSDPAVAASIAEFCNSPVARAEPVLWLPWLIIEYPSRCATKEDG